MRCRTPVELRPLAQRLEGGRAGQRVDHAEIPQTAFLGVLSAADDA